MSRDEMKLGYTKNDLVAAQKLLNIHNAKLVKAIAADNFAEACSAIRAIEDECANASRIAATLSFKSRVTKTTTAPRMGFGNNTGAFEK